MTPCNICHLHVDVVIQLIHVKQIVSIHQEVINVNVVKGFAWMVLNNAKVKRL